MVKPIPEGHHTVTPYMRVKGASEAIALYKKALVLKKSAGCRARKAESCMRN